MNTQLQDLYKQRFELLTPVLHEYNKNVGFKKKATNPFLIKIPDNYDSIKNKIMIFGQETNTWCKECGDKSAFSNNIEKSLKIYENFYLNGGIKKYRGPFWNEFKRIVKQVNKTNKSVVVWNNVNKIGRIGKGNVDKINQIQFKYFQVIKQEVELLTPNVMVFLTGQDYDSFIRKNIGDFSQELISDSLYRLKFKGAFENIAAFKTYHPNGLYHLKKNRIVIPNLIQEIRNVSV